MIVLNVNNCCLMATLKAFKPSTKLLLSSHEFSLYFCDIIILLQMDILELCT